MKDWIKEIENKSIIFIFIKLLVINFNQYYKIVIVVKMINRNKIV